MKKRSEEILQSLVRNKKNNSIETLKKRYKISERTIRNDLAEINEFLKNLHMSGIYFDVDGFLNTGPDFDSMIVERELINLDTYIYKLSPLERRIYISLLLLWNNKYLVMKNIADELYVSRVTILNDFDVIKNYFECNEIEVISDAGKGVYIHCLESKRIFMLVELLRKIMLDVENEGFFQRYVIKQLNIQYTFSDICSYAQEYLRINNLVFIDDALYTTILYFFIVFNLRLNSTYLKNVEITDFNIIDNLMMFIGYKLGCQVSEKMLIEFRKYISENAINLYIKSLDEVELYEIITHFLLNIDQDMNLQLSMDDILIDSLLLHIKNMREWGEVEFEFSEMNEIVFEYRKLLSVVTKNLYVLEKYLSYKINENMKKSIMIHICAAMIRANEKSKKPSIVIVCPGSMATGKYLEVQIKNYFDFNILGLFPVTDISRELEKIENVDFIVSTVQLYDLNIQCLKVHAVLTIQDMNLIQKTAFEYQNKIKKPKEKNQVNVNNISQLLQNKDIPDSLYKKIEEMILEYENKEIEKTAIGELLDQENIIFDDSDFDWQQAIRAAADILIKKGCIGTGFVEKAIQNIKDYGDYIILGEGVALAHAGKDYDVYEDSLSLLISRSGIIFSEGDREVNFLFCFSSRGINDYVELFREIVEIGQEESQRDKLLLMSENELYHALCFK